ncbi:MAG TPA: class I SAM-dependent RNA methyltransferase [Thermomicrobiales bacterium]|nr:class I SAM-dependent RNA methyltransferase [Thermomicrobiales bacterium]
MSSQNPRPPRKSTRPTRPQRPAPAPRGGQRRQPSVPAPDLVIDNLRIERIVGDGLGIGFEEDGLAVFVPRTAPGDVIRARVTKRQGKVYHAAIEEIVEPSPIRIEPRVPDYDASGGLDFQHLGYDDQVTIKAGIIGDSLRRIAKLDPVPDIGVIPSPNPWHYRSRAEFQIDHAAGAVGFFAAGSHRVVDVEESPVLTLETQALLSTLRDDVQAGLVPKANREYRAVTGDLGSVLEPTSTQKSRMVTRDLGGETFRYSAECFFQANIPVTAAILEDVLGIADQATSERGLALDLYCGVGLFTLPLARKFKQVIGVESFKPAADYAESNLSNAGLTNARIVTAPVEHWLAGDRSPLGRVALAVFDPPRSGAGKETIERLVRLKPAHVAAVSCDPATFARDVRDLVETGYEVVRITGYDMFPQTHHVEIVGHLKRREP